MKEVRKKKTNCIFNDYLIESLQSLKKKCKTYDF